MNYNTDMTFDSLGLSQAVLGSLSRKGFEEPTPIQSLTIPRLMGEGPALVARARTGTGKTAAFGIPLVEKLGEYAPHIRALVLVPTRELALQVTGEIASLKSQDRPRIVPVYGGASMGEQLRRIAAGADIIVGTPGRVLDHIERGTLKLENIEYFILDEADEMLDMGFIEDIETIMSRCNNKARTVLFSATMPRPILEIVSRHFGEFETVEDSTETVTTELADQLWLEILERDRLEALCRIMDIEEAFFGIVFTATRVESENVAKSLAARGYDAEALHGDLSQEQRERILGKFREKRLSVLVATDVASRGIDIDNLSHVVNWSLPHDPDSYVHRVGRTGRAGNTGTAITFVTPDEYRKLFRFRKAAGSPLRKGSIPEVKDVLAARKERVKSSILARAAALAFITPEPVIDPAPDSDADLHENSLEHGESVAVVAADAGSQDTVPVTVTESGTIAPSITETITEKHSEVEQLRDAGKAVHDTNDASLNVSARSKESRSASASPKVAGQPAAKKSSHARAWLSFADEILERLDPREALASILLEAFGSELDPGRYKDISEVSVDSTAIARLFIGAGRRDRLTPRDLVSMIRRVSGVPDRLIGSIEILDTFSFVSVPFEAAERIIASAKKAGGMPFVKLAAPRGKEGGDSHVRTDRGGSGKPFRPGFGRPSRQHDGGGSGDFRDSSRPVEPVRERDRDDRGRFRGAGFADSPDRPRRSSGHIPGPGSGAGSGIGLGSGNHASTNHPATGDAPAGGSPWQRKGSSSGSPRKTEGPASNYPPRKSPKRKDHE